MYLYAIRKSNKEKDKICRARNTFNYKVLSAYVFISNKEKDKICQARNTFKYKVLSAYIFVGYREK